MDPLLSPQTAALLDAERRALTALQHLFEETEADPETAAQLADLIRHLDALFLVVVVGEFNAGKSSVLNALFGEKIMEEGPIPTTAKITILRHGDERMERQISPYLLERRHPADLLRYLHLVDTPGTNSIIRQHQQITEDFIPRSDLVLFVTSFDRPLAESERQFLSFIRDTWGRRLVFVLNKADLARTDEALHQVIEHIRSGCRELMGFEPRIFPVSADVAYTAKTTEAPAARAALWEKSRFEALEHFITQTLAGPERLTLKLTAPLDTAARLLERLQQRLEARRRVLAQDEQNLETLQQHVEGARAELRADYGRALTEIDNLLLELERRGVQFLEDTIRVSKLSMLRDRDRFKEEFTRQVVRDTDRHIEDRVTEAVDRLLQHALTLWNRTLGEFNERVHRVEDGPRATAQGDFAYNRAEVFDGIMREARRRIETYNVREEARRILENARDAADLFKYTEAGAAGLGALGAVLVVASSLDAVGGFGLATAGVVAAAGFAYLPRQRRKAVTEYRTRLEALRGDMKVALTEQFEREIEAALGRVHETMEPYAVFVERERTTLARAAQGGATLQDEIARLLQTVREEIGTTTVE